MLTNQRVLLWGRVLVGVAGVAAGWLTYPTGRIVPAERAVPLALIIAGATFAGHAGLDLAWGKLSRQDATRPTAAEQRDAADGAQTAIGAFVAAITTVLGLLAVFGLHPTFAVRLGALVLVIGAILGLMILIYVAYGIGGPATASMLAWLVSILFGTTIFGLACIGLAIFFR